MSKLTRWKFKATGHALGSPEIPATANGNIDAETERDARHIVLGYVQAKGMKAKHIDLKRF